GEAARRLETFGPNEAVPRRSRSALRQFLALFLNPLVIILLVAAMASALLGQLIEAAIIVTIVALGVIINFVQSYQSQKAADRLREQVAPTATVLRDGEWREIRRVDVVPDDVIHLCAGDLVPADARLLESRDLYVQQGALTGESIPAEKEATEARSGETSGPEARHLVFLGTSVVSGTATAVVLATGPRTVFGDIARRLTKRPEETEFERGLRQFSMLIMRAVFFLVLFIVVVRVALHRQPLESVLFAVALGVGLTPEFLPMITSVTLARGAVRMARRKVIVKHLPAIQNFGSIDVLCSDKTGTITTGKMTVDSAVDAFGEPSEETRRLAWINSHFETGLHSPLDAAILKSGAFDMAGYDKLDEIPFDFERRRSSIVVRRTGDGGECLLLTKGAPEGILPVCIGMDQAALTRAHSLYNGLSSKGLRVLAVASRRIDDRERYSKSDECDLTLAGFLSFLDPPVEDATEVIDALKRDGVTVKILTGDSELVACHICEIVGLDGARAISGQEIEHLGDSALEHVVENASVFARISPAQKTRILLALRRRGHVVGFMGDGINDAPSLHAADVGISVSSAVDVARDAAEIILTEPGLRILHNGIMEGRRAFGNVTKYLLMGTSSNFGNMFSMAGASLFLPFLPMLPSQILLNNFLYDLAQVTIPTDNVDEEYLRNPQRWNIGLIRNFMILIGPVSSIFDFLTFYVLLRFFRASEPLFHTGWFAESLATQTLVLFVIRTMKKPWQSRPSLPLTLTTLAVASTAILFPMLPVAARIGFTPLPPAWFAFLAVATLLYLSLVELAKHHVGLGLPRRRRASASRST
ncbi:MAG TPA: magnesium-translocating P-type ATPase, partial [Bryobacteraceae bacterium]|nr:magnesium-translocating P-type ATPase [Bryobacteraceae bacterium]